MRDDFQDGITSAELSGHQRMYLQCLLDQCTEIKSHLYTVRREDYVAKIAYEGLTRAAVNIRILLKNYIGDDRVCFVADDIELIEGAWIGYCAEKRAA